MDPRPVDPFQPGLLQRLDLAPREVAIVRASRIGDFVCATPALRALRHALPAARLTLVGLPVIRDLAARLPSLDRFVAFPGFPGMAEQFFDARRTTAFFAKMQGERFDLAIQLHGTGVCSNPFTLMLGAGVSCGMVRPGDPAGRLDAAFAALSGCHEVESLLSFTAFLGAPRCGDHLELGLSGADLEEAEGRLAGPQPPLIGIHPGAREATKRWAPESFALAAKALQRQHGGTLVLIGGPDELPSAALVERASAPRCVNLAGRLSLPVMAAVIGRLSVLVTNDSGPAHIAYALGTPSVTIFGGTDAGRWGPKDSKRHLVVAREVPCRPCDGDHCPVGFRCLAGVAPGEVVARVGELAGRCFRPKPPLA